MSFKKNPTLDELKEEVEALQHQVVSLNNQNLALKKQIYNQKNMINNHPAVVELAALKSKWWVKLLNWK